MQPSCHSQVIWKEFAAVNALRVYFRVCSSSYQDILLLLPASVSVCEQAYVQAYVGKVWCWDIFFNYSLLIFWYRSLTEPGTHWFGKTGWPASSRDHFCLFLSTSGVIDMQITHGLLHGWWRWNLDVCMARTLPNEPSLIEFFHSSYTYYIVLIKYDRSSMNFLSLIYTVMLLPWWGLLKLLPSVLCIYLFHIVGNKKCKSSVGIIKLP